jgi:hypothetical protein
VVTHRVVRIVSPGDDPVVITKGDANPRRDPWRLRLVSGPAWKVRTSIPDVGGVVLALQRPLVRTGIAIVSVSALSLALVGGPGVGRRRGRRRRSRRVAARPLASPT